MANKGIIGSPTTLSHVLPGTSNAETRQERYWASKAGPIEVEQLSEEEVEARKAAGRAKHRRTSPWRSNLAGFTCTCVELFSNFG